MSELVWNEAVREIEYPSVYMSPGVKCRLSVLLTLNYHIVFHWHHTNWIDQLTVIGLLQLVLDRFQFQACNQQWSVNNFVTCPWIELYEAASQVSVSTRTSNTQSWSILQHTDMYNTDTFPNVMAGLSSLGRLVRDSRKWCSFQLFVHFVVGLME